MQQPENGQSLLYLERVKNQSIVKLPDAESTHVVSMGFIEEHNETVLSRRPEEGAKVGPLPIWKWTLITMKWPSIDQLSAMTTARRYAVLPGSMRDLK